MEGIKKYRLFRIYAYHHELGQNILSKYILDKFLNEIDEDIMRVDILLSKRIITHDGYNQYIKNIFFFYRRMNRVVISHNLGK